MKNYYSAIRQLNWLANTTTPKISFQVSNISSKIVDATISDIKQSSKIIKIIKESQITFPSLCFESTKILMFSDASFNNLCDGYSQGGHRVFIADKFNMSCPVSWKSTEVCHVARSNIAAETLAFTKGAHTACFINQLFELLSLIPPTLQITTYTGNKSLHGSAKTTSQILDPRLHVETSAIMEMNKRGEINLQWINEKRQIVDGLTKKGVTCISMLTTLKNRKLHENVIFNNCTYVNIPKIKQQK